MAEQFQLPSPLSEVQKGVIPGVSIPPIGPKLDPLQQFVTDHFDEVLESGLDVYETKDAVTVLFNPRKLSESKLAAAEKAGTLLELAPPANASAAPAQASAEPAQAAAPAGPLAGMTAAPAPNRQMQTKRLQNLAALEKRPAEPNSPLSQLSRRPL